MRAPLTDFGRQNLTRLSRLRVAVAAAALAIALALRTALPTYPLLPLALLLLLETIHGIVIILLQSRVPVRRLVQVALSIDTLILCGVVLFTGGLAGGFASVYVWIVIA
ncbi:MAG: hypothetical protein ACM3JD_04500, partial [Rudaea sp.]